MERRSKEHEDEYASLASKVWESGRENASQAPAVSLTADPGQELLQTASALNP